MGNQFKAYIKLTYWNFICILVSVLADNYCLLPSQERLDQLAMDNEQLKTEVQELLNSSSLNTSLRDQGESQIPFRFKKAFNFSNFT